MVTLANTQNLNEFELHLYAVLGFPIPGITQEHIGASAVILSPVSSQKAPQYRGEECVCSQPNTYLRIFGKPATRLNKVVWEWWFAMTRMTVIWMHFVISVSHWLPR